jgi:hypothetical protein
VKGLQKAAHDIAKMAGTSPEIDRIILGLQTEK